MTPRPAHQNQQLLGPGNAGVQQVAVAQLPGRVQHGDDHRGEFVALALVDGDGIGGLQLVGGALEIVDHVLVVNADVDGPAGACQSP